MSYKVTGSWTGSVEEQHPTLEMAHQRANALLMEHPNANIRIAGENLTATVQTPAAAPVQA